MISDESLQNGLWMALTSSSIIVMIRNDVSRFLLMFRGKSIMPFDKPQTRNPWAWVTTLYFAQGIPYVVAMTVSVIMYKRLGMSNTDIALYTSWLYLPW